MHNAGIAEWVLGLAIDPDRASSIVGDLWEERGSAFSFWAAILQTTLAHLWSDFWRHPGALAWLVFSGFLVMILIGVGAALVAGTVISLWIRIAPFPVSPDSVYIPAWGYYLLGFAAATTAPFLAGWNLAWRSRARGLGGAILFLTVTALLLPAIDGRSGPYPWPDNWLARHITPVSVALGVFTQRLRYLRRERRLFMP